MHRRLLPLFILLVYISAFSTSSAVFAAFSPDDNISQNKVKLQQMSDKIIGVNAQISSLNAQIEKLNGTIKKNNNDINEGEKLIKTAEDKMNVLQNELSENQNLADSRVRAIYKNGGSISYLSLILTSRDFSDFISRVDATEKIAAYDKNIMEDLQSKKEVLNNSIMDLNSKNQQLKQLKDSNMAALKQIKDKKKDLEGLVGEFNKEKAAAAAAIEENEKILIGHSVVVIDSKNPTIADMRDAVATLKSLLPALSTASVQKSAKMYIDDGERKLAALIASSSDSSNSNTSDVTYKATYSMVATAYAGDNFTSLGIKPVRDPAGLSTIAVDPSVIPLGTKVYIPGYGNAICADTGGAIKGNIIDVFLNSEEECDIWGRKTVTLYIVAYPGEW
ncbi:MAG: 3D domain-containing protein [Bacillota bacterium]|nr:3D domain-containing protein [Bacillota bacterium]